jgi:divalent metal cation (Fe/Co/Zn/Cd) transporter
MDEALELEVIEKIHSVLAEFEHKRGESSIIRFDHVSTRRAGQRRYVDLHMHMPSSWSLGRAASLRLTVEQALLTAVPGLRASIQLLTTDVEAHGDQDLLI